MLKKTVLLLKMTEKDSRHVFKKCSCNNIFIMKNNTMYVLGTTSTILGTLFKTILQPIYTIAVTAAL